MATPKIPTFTNGCPMPKIDAAHVLLAHGGGGTLMRQLIERVFVQAFNNPRLAPMHDGALLSLGDQRLAFTTDSFVVRPLQFPGGDIGSLAVHGTVNDLAMCGARPLWLSAGFILEEGFPMGQLQAIVGSMQRAAQAAGVEVVTGDTKVVDRGKGDGVFINTAGIGVMEHQVTISPARIATGDCLLVNGDLGRHGIAIMVVREGLAFESAIESDSAPLADLVRTLLDAGIALHCLRDLTRGGLASALVELSDSAHATLAIDERAIPVREDVRGACELLGLDPLYVANEGRLVAFVASQDAERALALMRQHPQGAGAALIGSVRSPRPTDAPRFPGPTRAGTGSAGRKANQYRKGVPRSHRLQPVGRGSQDRGLVTVTSQIGSERILDMLSGEQLPRIC